MGPVESKSKTPLFILAVVVVLIIVALVSHLALRRGFPKELPFSVIDQQYYADLSEKTSVAITTQADFEKYWNEVYSNQSPIPDLPSVDFKTDIVILVSQGVKSTGGFSIEVTKIVENVDSVEAFIKESEPDLTGGTTQALTHPYQFVKIKKTSKRMMFTRE